MTLDAKLTALRDLIQVDIGNRGLARDPERNLINACPGDFAAACRGIAQHPAPKVAIITGFWIANADPPCGETDGPLGAVYLARAFHDLGIGVELITDFFCARALAEGLAACGLSDRVAVLTLPSAQDSWPAYLDADWGKNNRGVTHVIAIERVGPASDGRCYSMRGRDITEFMCPAELLTTHLSQQGVATIGIGDGGNEIGMGKLPVEAIERNIPNGRQIACRVPADRLIVAGISNWGGYGLAAGVALVLGRKLGPALFDADLELRILRRMVERGPLVDGKTAQPTATVDGVPFAEYVKPLSRIREILKGHVQ
jgi:D-glutamate cyclase